MTEDYFPPNTSDIISARVGGWSRKPPRMELVMVMAPGLRTPRIVMQLWLASMITATPRGFRCFMIRSAISSVIRSCTCGRLATASTTRASFDSPTILPFGKYAMWPCP